jgi:Co/Zn/Cd efflux system component
MYTYMNMHTHMQVHEFHVWSLNMSTFLCTVHVVLQTDDTKEVNRTVDRYTLN